MKSVFGLLLIIGGIALGIYFGLWVCLIGGIVQILNAIKDPGGIHSMTIAWGVVKILFAGFIGTISALVLIVPGGVMMGLYED